MPAAGTEGVTAAGGLCDPSESIIGDYNSKAAPCNPVTGIRFTYGVRLGYVREIRVARDGVCDGSGGLILSLLPVFAAQSAAVACLLYSSCRDHAHAFRLDLIDSTLWAVLYSNNIPVGEQISHM